MSNNPPPTNKGKKFVPEPLTKNEVRALIDAVPNTVAGTRLRGIIGLLYGSGLRINECLSLMPRDLDTEGGYVRVRRGKGAKHRTVGIDPNALELITPWIEKRKELGLTREHYLFSSYRGKYFGNKMSRRYVANVLVKLAEDAEIDKRMHPHGLRHSFASDLADRGVPLGQIQRQLGHSSIVTTERYISSLNPQDIIDMMRDREW